MSDKEIGMVACCYGDLQEEEEEAGGGVLEVYGVCCVDGSSVRSEESE